MLLKIVDGETFRDIGVEEGEMFLLPGEPDVSCCDHIDRSANTPHNPVQFANTTRNRHLSDSPDRLEW